LTLRNDRIVWQKYKFLSAFIVCAITVSSQLGSMPSHVDAADATALGIVIPSAVANEAVRPSGNTLGHNPQSPYPTPKLVWLRLNLPYRADFGMAYDEDRQQVIVFGGQAGGDLSTWAQTWAWDGQDWTQLQTYINPPEGMTFPAQLV
jgi:hypothetical protein